MSNGDKKETNVINTTVVASKIRFQVTLRTGAVEVTYGAETIDGLMELRRRDEEFQLQVSGDNHECS